MSTDAISGVWEFLDDAAKPLVWIPTEDNRYRIFTTYGIITDKGITADDIGGGTCEQQIEITVEVLNLMACTTAIPPLTYLASFLI